MTQLAVTYVLGTTGPTNQTWTQTTLDGMGRAIKVQSGPGSTPGNAVTETDTVYGPCACSPTGKMTQVSQPFVPGATQYWNTYTYDAIGRTVKVVSPDGASTTTTTYQGNATTVADPAGK
jgi:YD repeat-containing protein